MAGKSTQIRPFGPEAIASAAALIREGQPVAVPTETVYGLAADATNARAVARIYEAKGRPIYVPERYLPSRVGVSPRPATPARAGAVAARPGASQPAETT